MKADIIRSKLSKYHHAPSDTILLEVIEGIPRSPSGGMWIEAKVEDIEKVTEDTLFNRDTSGYGKYLDKWFGEGLITEVELRTGKSAV